MIPKHPFPADFTPESEVAEFRRLQPQLWELWNALSAREEQPYTSVVVPSMTLDPQELEKLEGSSFYEERLLFLLIRLRNPQARMVYVTSQPVHPLILEYYFQLLVGIPASHARSRLTLLCAHDSSPRPLTEKILERPRLIQRIRYGIDDPERAFLTVFNSTPLERRLAVVLGIPLNGVDPDLQTLGTKSGGRRVFREAGIAVPEGSEGVSSEDDVVGALTDLKARKPETRCAVIKLENSFSGEGNAVFEFPEPSTPAAIREALPHVAFSVLTETPDAYYRKLREMGGIVEEFLEGGETRSPSCQLRIDPHGGVSLISTHDQILGGPTGQVYLGCRFPASEDYRRLIQSAGEKVGRVLAARGVVSRFGVDFLVRRSPGGADWEVFALEINLRVGGTTHPFLALQFLTGGQLDAETGLFHSPSGMAKFYRSTDNLKSEGYRGLLPEDLLDITTFNRLHYSHGTEKGVLFHMMGALSQYGKVGLTVIGNTVAEVDELYAGAIAVLDRESAPAGGASEQPLREATTRDAPPGREKALGGTRRFPARGAAPVRS